MGTSMLALPAGRPAPSSAPPTGTYGHPVQTRPQRGLAPGAIVILAIAAAALCAGAVVLTLAEAPAGDRVWAAVTSALVIAAPIGVGLATLARRQDRFAAILVAAGALWSLTVLAQSHDATLVQRRADRRRGSSSSWSSTCCSRSRRAG